MIFARAYTAKELNRGEGMTFHPVSGERLSTLQYCTHGRWWAKSIPLPQMGWDAIQYRHEYLPCINGGRKRYAVGEAYPSHWKFDPFTGVRLNALYSNIPNLDYVQ